ncbi:hypothetical protein I6A84_27355 [Frankia sp. CNm7]|uniref:Uncharacterized protein n=1 Tax=Frankia nepalensis TaxID=1836974 RepID=A0A937UTU3_9ACTN|nr:hypothetical protein [Frankia nepalensis]MBL7496456.1 hypothetical protein [Frankia nepalensis]MBL7510807.1 hypothetical protein [Frankia nepalensis]MBL7521696.1 hypothetical protein [Frankia nepalensis]MBL7631605.1 hypothetical protein [Frankia nepalensis]
MPSSAHETPIELIRLDPSLPDWVQTELLGDDAPAFEHARLHDPNVRTRTYQADAMVLLCGPDDKPTRATVYENQRRRDPDKLGTWKLYIGQMESEFRVKASLVVFVPDATVAKWYREQIALDTRSGAWLRPWFFTPADVPLIVDERLAVTRPARVLLSAMCHLDDAAIDAMFPALLAALNALEPDVKIFYDDETAGSLPAAARARWEAFLMTTALGRRYHNERYNEIDARAEARGEARGEARAVLTVLEARGLPVTDTLRERIMACTDLDQLSHWLRHASTATTTEDVEDLLR